MRCTPEIFLGAEWKRIGELDQQMLYFVRIFLKAISEAAGLLVIKWLVDTQFLVRELYQREKCITKVLLGHT